MDETNDAGGEEHPEPTPERRALQVAATKQRWADVLLMVLAATTVVLLLGAVAPGQDLALPITRNSPWPFLAALSIGLCVVGLCVGPRQVVKFLSLNLSASLRYPPVFVASLLGMAVLAAVSLGTGGVLLPSLREDLWGSPRNIGYALPYFLLVYWPASIVGYFVWITWFAEPTPPKPALSEAWKADSIQASDITQEWFENWIKDDKEIERPEDDAFGQHRRIAKTIGDRMIDTSQGRGSGTTQLVGGLGSGKSTIGKLTRCYLDQRGVLEQPGGVLFAQVSLFGYDNAQAAVRGVLTAAIAEIGKVAPTLALSGVPAQYLHAAAAQTPGMDWLTGLLSIGINNDDLQTILKKMDDVLAAVGCELVLWVEDLERFAGNDVIGDDQSELMQQNEVERLAPVRAMLYHLDRAAHISVVVADTSLRSRFDVEKIAKWQHRAPTHLAEGFSNVFDLLVASLVGTEAESAVRDVSHIGDARTTIAAFAGNHRTLKSLLRLARQLVLQSSGEIDLARACQISVLRVVFPSVYTTVDLFIQEISSLESIPMSIDMVDANALDRDFAREVNRTELSPQVDAAYQLCRTITLSVAREERYNLVILLRELFPRLVFKKFQVRNRIFGVNRGHALELPRLWVEFARRQ